MESLRFLTLSTFGSLLTFSTPLCAQDSVSWALPAYGFSEYSIDLKPQSDFAYPSLDYYSGIDVIVQSSEFEELLGARPDKARLMLENYAYSNSPIARTAGDIAYNQLDSWAGALIQSGKWDGSLAQDKYGYGLNIWSGTESYVSPDMASNRKSIYERMGIEDPRDKIVVGDPTGVPIKIFLENRVAKMDRLKFTSSSNLDCNYFKVDVPKYCRRAKKDGFDTRNLFFLATFESKSSQKSFGVAAVAIIVSKNGILDQNNGTYLVLTEPNTASIAGKQLPICPGTEYPDTHRTSGGYCTGFLTEIGGKQVFATAAHCATSLSNKWKDSWVVFGLSDVLMSGAPVQVDRSQVFRLAELPVLGTEYNRSAENDFAIFRLDRQVDASVAAPLKLSTNDKPAVNSLLALVGYPAGMSQKIDHAIDKGEPVVVAYAGRDDVLMRVATDSNHGSSGSPVFSASDGNVVSILISGQRDYIEAEGEACARPNVVQEIGRSMETALRISSLPVSIE